MMATTVRRVLTGIADPNMGVKVTSAAVLLRTSRRSAHAFADKWTLAHSTVGSVARRWPRPNSPLAGLIDSAGAEQEAWSPGAEQRLQDEEFDRRLPPIDEAPSFDHYMSAIQTTSSTASQPSVVAEQIRETAQNYRQLRRRPLSQLPQAGPIVQPELESDLLVGAAEALTEQHQEQQQQHQHQEQQQPSPPSPP